MVLKDDIDMVIDERNVVVKISDRESDVLGGDKLISVDDGSSGKVVNDPVMMVLMGTVKNGIE